MMHPDGSPATRSDLVECVVTSFVCYNSPAKKSLAVSRRLVVYRGPLEDVLMGAARARVLFCRAIVVGMLGRFSE
jgi:hypothetical protein